MRLAFPFCLWVVLASSYSFASGFFCCIISPFPLFLFVFQLMFPSVFSPSALYRFGYAFSLMLSPFQSFWSFPLLFNLTLKRLLWCPPVCVLQVLALGKEFCFLLARLASCWLVSGYFVSSLWLSLCCLARWCTMMFVEFEYNYHCVFLLLLGYMMYDATHVPFKHI